MHCLPHNLLVHLLLLVQVQELVLVQVQEVVLVLVQLSSAHPPSQHLIPSLFPLAPSLWTSLSTHRQHRLP